MTSQINGSAIIADYPKAGEDNDSQGFRDNFATIKSSLSTAAIEVTALQDNTAKLNLGNNFLGNTLSNAMLSSVSEHYYNASNVGAGEVTSDQPISFLNGHYQRFVIATGTTINFTLADWPGEDNKVSKITLELVRSSDAGDNPIVNFQSDVAGQLRTNGTLSLPLTLGNDTFPTILEFWTHDGGLTIYCQSLGQFNAV